jgi:hypothetical protein
MNYNNILQNQTQKKNNFNKTYILKKHAKPMT